MTDTTPTRAATEQAAARHPSDHDGIALTTDIDLAPSTPPSVDLHDPQVRRAVEATLTAIPGVLGARIVAGFERRVDEIHVLTTLERSPKPTVRDVQSVLMARYAVPCDHRVISVVQLDELDPSLTPDRRPLIATVGVTRSGQTVAARVELRDGGQLTAGEAQGPATPTGRRRAVAAASLEAVRALLADDTELTLDGIEVLEVAGRAVVVAVVALRAGRTAVTLSGSALVDDVPDDATARAVLDAVNRILGAPVS